LRDIGADTLIVGDPDQPRGLKKVTETW